MTAKEKAAELVKKFTRYTPADEDLEYDYAKQCALIAVDEILSLYWNDVNGIAFWNSVKTEINAL